MFSPCSKEPEIIIKRFVNIAEYQMDRDRHKIMKNGCLILSKELPQRREPLSKELSPRKNLPLNKELLLRKNLTPSKELPLNKELSYDKPLDLNEMIHKISEQRSESEDSINEGELFILWMFTQTRRYDNIGKLSRLIKEEVFEKKHFPQKPSKYQIMMHLISHNINNEGRHAFASAWGEFETLKQRYIKGEIDDF